jgi:hypothetical protein
MCSIWQHCRCTVYCFCQPLSNWIWLDEWLVVNKVVFPCNVSPQQSKFKNDMNIYLNLKLITVRSVVISVLFVINGVVQTKLPTHAVRTCGNVL